MPLRHWRSWHEAALSARPLTPPLSRSLQCAWQRRKALKTPPPPPLCARLSTLEHEVVTAGATVGRLARQVPP